MELFSYVNECMQPQLFTLCEQYTIQITILLTDFGEHISTFVKNYR